jgi:hypothetical protein
MIKLHVEKREVNGKIVNLNLITLTRPRERKVYTFISDKTINIR